MAAVTTTARSLMLPAAAQPDIIRANQKDAYALIQLREKLVSVVQLVAGNHAARSWQHELPVVADVLYYCLTTLAGQQTLGEEYCEIIQTDAGNHTPSRLPRRMALVFLQVLAPYLALRAYSRLGETAVGSPDSRLSTVWKYLALSKSWVQQDLPLVHLAIFYFVGTYYSLAKRLTRTTYTFSRQLALGEERPGYQVLGFLIAIQLAARARTAVMEYVATPNQDAGASAAAATGNVKLTEQVDVQDEDDEEAEDPQRKCSLCLETRTDSAVTPCGHLFCWTCICEWCANKPECPLCRQAIIIPRILPLYNF